MSNTSRSSGWIWSTVFTVVVIIGSFFVWSSRQSIVDAIAYHSFEPSSAISELAEDSSMTDHGRFLFYVTQPQINTSEEFNQNCQRREANSVILGCYAAGRIYVYDVTDERLDGIKVVTAAHEMLHSAYERLSEAEKSRLTTLLEAAYERIADDELESRMEYYERTEPGQRVNELHSILGTESKSLGSELESYYSQYFDDRDELVTLHASVEQVFDRLSDEADGLVARIEALADSINRNTARYNMDVERLNQDIAAFNQRAQSSGGFQTQGEFDQERRELAGRSEQLSSLKQSIDTNTVSYRNLIARLDAINSESQSLSRSLDSVPQDTPEL